VAGALKHHFVDKDATLRRMWFGASNAPKTTGEHSTILPLGSALIAWAAALFIGTAIGVFEHGDQAQETAALETVASDWTVQSGAISIKIDQFGSEVTGSFEDWTAAITFDPDTGLGTAEVTIAITSLTLGSVTSQALGPDFFDTATFQTAVFAADLTPTADGHMASGTLQIRDKTLPIEMPFALSTADGVTSMQAMTTLNRLDFDIGKGMGDESSLKFPVDVQIMLTATPN
jgi:polyisoprenoid-binding protein YceI